MYDKKQNIHYCTILSAEQWDFLLEGKFSTHRQKCLYKLMTDAVQVETSYKIKGVEIALEVGEVAASDVELAEYLGCNRKTIGKLIDSFNRLGMLTTRTNNRTSIHTLHFLTGWYVGGVLITNPHYVRPSATAKGRLAMCGHLTMTKPNQEVPNRLFGMAVKTPRRKWAAWKRKQHPFLLPSGCPAHLPCPTTSQAWKNIPCRLSCLRRTITAYLLSWVVWVACVKIML